MIRGPSPYRISSVAHSRWPARVQVLWEPRPRECRTAALADRRLVAGQCARAQCAANRHPSWPAATAGGYGIAAAFGRGCHDVLQVGHFRDADCQLEHRTAVLGRRLRVCGPGRFGGRSALRGVRAPENGEPTVRRYLVVGGHRPLRAHADGWPERPWSAEWMGSRSLRTNRSSKARSNVARPLARSRLDWEASAGRSRFRRRLSRAAIEATSNRTMITGLGFRTLAGGPSGFRLSDRTLAAECVELPRFRGSLSRPSTYVR